MATNAAGDTAEGPAQQDTSEHDSNPEGPAQQDTSEHGSNP
ncbi:hypothetical protein MTO96_050207, partial [Rhipicephalus appendiculatus]